MGNEALKLIFLTFGFDTNENVFKMSYCLISSKCPHVKPKTY